jgi:hypothetical protein
MRVIIISLVVTALSIISVMFSRLGLASELTPIMPAELIAYAAKNGCEQVSDFFFIRREMVNPPYVYDYRPDMPFANAALWCQVGQGDKRRFFLLLMIRNRNHEWAQCPTKIEWRNYPRGLSIYRDKRATLAYFVYLADPKKRGPANTPLSGNGISNQHDGIGETLYCHQGEWLIRHWD